MIARPMPPGECNFKRRQTTRTKADKRHSLRDLADHHDCTSTDKSTCHSILFTRIRSNIPFSKQGTLTNYRKSPFHF